MEIRLEEHTVREVAKDFSDSAENGCTGYAGKLNIRPAFQREFIYPDKKRNAVINTVMQGFPLNVMYWSDVGGGKYEMIDGQQRTISICMYVSGDFAFNEKYFHSLTPYEQNKILDYKLMIYVCKGNDKEKLDWFKTINIAGEVLTPQELRNAVYTGEWLTDAKRRFSKNGCPAYKIGSRLLSGSHIRQEYLETAIEWTASNENKTIEAYMSEHQHDTNASAMWLYFQQVINWVNTLFFNYRKEMKGLNWGKMYHLYGKNSYDPSELEKRTAELMQDDDIDSRKGIYEYLLSGNERFLNIRAFTDNMKRQAYERQNGICPLCGGHFEIDEMEGDHIDPWHSGGKTTSENCQMLCRPCNRRKSSK